MNKEYKYRHGVSVMRAQPFHIGHDRIIKNMLTECEKATVVLYSVPESGENRNPLSYNLRKQMIENIYKGSEYENRLKIIGFFNKYNPKSWSDVDVMDDIFTELPKGDVFYVGNERDADKFKSLVDNLKVVDRTSSDFPYVTATMVRDLIKSKNESWKKYIHPENYQLLEGSVLFKF
ncbi:MAG: hypothetical protein LBR70_06565 [Lactobacillaceae bacterium]|jgi:citrate lyase synthetase|nr:hypothetical protein [Lactobacillaceae bacterium]